MALLDFSLELTCSICRSLYTDPVTIRCGHNFCKVCITKTWESQEDGESSCPECRTRFIRKPELIVNVRLRNMAENIRAKQPKIFCGNCSAEPDVAYKSCLLCEVSLCRYHVELHLKASKDHILSEPTLLIHKRVCFAHKKVLEFYCHDDDVCVCRSCHQEGDHKGHRVELLHEAATKKKEDLKSVLPELNANRVKIGERLISLKSQKEELQDRAARASERSNALFKDTRKKVKEIEKSVLTAISKQKEQASHKYLELAERLTAERDCLSKHIDLIEELAECQDPLTVLQDQESSGSNIFQVAYGDFWKEDDQDFQIVMDLTEHQISAMLNLCLANILAFVRKASGGIRPAGLTVLDVDTAGDYVCVSEDGRTASWSQLSQNRPDNLARFQGANQVMSTRAFSLGVEYLDVEASLEGVWIIGMSYGSIDRAEYESFIGLNRKSWGLCKSDNQYSLKHDSREIVLPLKVSARRFRVCVDYERGQISFYEKGSPTTLLHTFTTTFTEPLYPIFSVWGKGKVTLL
ncbi:E3 ubiquitin/ISG15 ligase TRIM25-like [Gastrophryne carolinensis]